MELREIKARKVRFCDWCRREIRPGEKYWGEHTRYLERVRGPGSRKGHLRWNFSSKTLCSECHDKPPKYSCTHCGKPLQLTDSVWAEKSRAYKEFGLLLRMGPIFRRAGEPDVLVHSHCPIPGSGSDGGAAPSGAETAPKMERPRAGSGAAEGLGAAPNGSDGAVAGPPSGAHLGATRSGGSGSCGSGSEGSGTPPSRPEVQEGATWSGGFFSQNDLASNVQKHPPKAFVSRLYFAKRTYLVRVPKEVVESADLKPGDRVGLLLLKDASLKLGVV